MYGDVHLLYLSIRKFNVKTPNGGGAGIIKLKKELIHLAFINLNIFVYFDMRGWVRERENLLCASLIPECLQQLHLAEYHVLYCYLYLDYEEFLPALNFLISDFYPFVVLNFWFEVS